MKRLFLKTIFIQQVLLITVQNQVVNAQAVSNAVVNISIDASVTLNKHADQVGIWINTNSDIDNTALKNSLIDLNLKMIRYGWQGGIFDKNNLTSCQQSPCDYANQGYLSNNCRINERFGPQRVSTFISDLNMYGIGVASADGVNYTGTSDSYIKNLSLQNKINFYSDKLVDWINWNKNNGNVYRYFELGNESDITNPLFDGGVGIKWTGANYGRVAKQMAMAAKNADPSIGLGINGGLMNDAGTIAWFDSVYSAAPDINNYISFVVTHKYEAWLDYITWRDHADWAFGKCAPGFLTSAQKHFPTKPLFITEIGSWKDATDKLAHYRACLSTEMFGNVFSDSAVATVQQWPTRWGDGTFYDNDNYTLTSMGLGVKAYTKFCHPNLVANNNNTGIRYFAEVNPVTKAMTVWFINHQESTQTINCSVSNFYASKINAQWRLTSPSNDPNSTQTSLWQDGAVTASGTGLNCNFSTTLPPVSVTVVVFEKSISTDVYAINNTQSTFNIYPNPADQLAVIGYQLSENCSVKISVVDVLGKEVMTIVNEKQDAGEHQLNINTSQLENGIYFVKMSLNNEQNTLKLIVNN